MHLCRPSYIDEPTGNSRKVTVVVSVLEFLRETTGLNIPDVDHTSSLASLPGWDSLALVRLSVGLEEALKRDLEIEELTKIESIADVKALLYPEA